MQFRPPRHTVFAPAATLDAAAKDLAQLLDTELTSTLDELASKQVKLQNAQTCMDSYVEAPMVEKADELAEWARLVQRNLDRIPENAESFVAESADGQLVVLQFGLTPGRGRQYESPGEEAAIAESMSQKLYAQQRKIDALEHKNEGIDAALRGWQKRVRMAAARGEVAGLVALREKILASSKRLGLRPKRLQAFRADDVAGI